MSKWKVIFSFIFYLFFAGFSYAADSYVLLDLGTMGNDWSYAKSINNGGVVVGDTGIEGFKWEPLRFPLDSSNIPLGRVTILPTLPSDSVEPVWISAESINDNNEIIGTAGYMDSALWVPHAVVWDSSENPEGIWYNGPGIDINSATHAIVSDIVFFESVFWTEFGAEYIIDIGEESNPQAINDRDQIVGWIIERDGEGGIGRQYAYLWDDGSIIDLNVFNVSIATRNLSRAVDINNLGQIVGDMDVTHLDDSFEYSSFLVSDGQVRDLGFEGARAVNDKGAVVGSHYLYESFQRVDASGRLQVYGGRLYNLNKLIRHKYRWSCRDLFSRVNPRCVLQRVEYKDLEVTDINKSGQIVGSAFIDGAEHAVLLLPIKKDGLPLLPKPTSMKVLPD
jgi:probable HAF family extracellular repeat protein